MPDEDPGDGFLRHRAAVLDALLADPALGRSAPPEAEQSFSGTDFSLEPDAGLEAITPSSAPAAPPPAGAGSSGPKASERILALLNGGAGAESAGLDLSGKLSSLASKESAPEPDTRAEPETSRPPATPLAERARDLLTVVRNPKVALVIGAAVIMVVILALVMTTGDHGSERESAQASMTPSPVPATAQTSVTPTAPAGGTIQVKSAVSHCPPGGTPGMDAFAGPGKAWSCSRAHRVDGQILSIDLGGSYTVESIGLVPGWDAIGADGTDQWTKYRTASRVSYRFDDAGATTCIQQTLDQRGPVVTRMNPPVNASKIVLTVLQSKGDPAQNITALSSIVITGH
ncbi:hypothetical protein ACIRRA_37620 [Nocardia sp. NPDC101769]|uniref:hypothetical protein n=1 Tax=Nocardia sp. NPDC101769 TaxID=3364333 RepID=UPI0037F9DBC4